MSKIFELDLRTGSYLEKITNKAPNVIQPFSRSKKGYCVKNVPIGLIYDVDIAVNNELTLISWYKLTASEYHYLPSLTDTSYSKALALFHLAFPGIRFRSTGYVDFAIGSIPKSPDSYYHLVATFNFISHAYSIYVGGNLIFSGTNASISKNYTSYSRVFVGGNNSKEFEFYKLIIYNNIITQKEISVNYFDFLNSKPLNKPIYFQPNLNILKPHELREEGLIAAYNMNPVNGKLINIAWDNPANGYNARQYDGNMKPAAYANPAQSLSDGIKCNQNPIQISSSAISLSNASILFTANFVDSKYNQIFSYTNNEYIEFNTSTNNFTLKILNQTLTINSICSNLHVGTNTIGLIKNDKNVKVYINGVLAGESNIAVSENMRITYIGNVASPVFGFVGFFKSVMKIYNRAITDQEIKAYHNQFASKIVLKEDFSQYPVGAVKFGNWQKVYLGSIEEEAISSSLIKKGKKFLKLTSFGTAMTQSLTAYGTWEFIFNLNISEGFYRVINFICNSTTSTRTEPLGNYSVWFVRSSGSTNINRIYLVKGTTWGAAGGDVATILNVNTSLGMDKYHTCKISRSTDGMFKIFINDQLIGSILDNTYTTCRYLSMSAYGTFIISDLTIKQGVEN